MAGLDQDAADEKVELYAEDFEQLSKTFPDISRRSTFLMIYSTYEHWLRVLCWRLQKIKKQEFGPQDMKGEFFGAQLYLNRLAGIKMGEYKEWKEITALRQIRNMLVHQGGNVRKGDAKFRELLNHTSGASLDDQDMVVLTHAFCLKSIATFRKYLSALVKDLEEVFP